MRPPAEQVVRDYLSRLTVAARALPPEDRQAFLARYQNLVERQSGVRDMADPADVMRALSGIGEPEALVERERARLEAQRKEREAAASKVSLWKPTPRAKGGRNGSAGGGQPRTGPRSIENLVRKDGRPVTGEIKVTTRPISSRWRPGEPLKPKKSRRGRVPPPPPDSSREPDRGAAADTGPPAEQPPAGPQAAAPHGAGPQVPEQRAAGASSGTVSSALAAAGGAAAAPGAAGAAAPGTPGPPASATPAPAGTADTPTPAGTAATPTPAGTSATPAPTRRLPRPVRPRLPRRLQPGDLTRDMARRAAETGRQHRRETICVVMLALGGLILPFPLWEIGFLLWLAGALIAATSKLWSLPDKWIGLVGPLALVIIGTAVAVSLGGARSTGSAYLNEALTTAMYLFTIGALLGAAYLAWRIYRGRRPGSIPPWLWRRHT
jgi:hypothetical protein